MTTTKLTTVIRRNKNQKGSIIFIIIATLALMTIPVLATFQYGNMLLFILGAERHSATARKAALNKAIYSGTPNEKRLVCDEQSDHKGRQTILRQICAYCHSSIIDSARNTNVIPAFNYNQIFSRATNCRSYTHISGTQSITGKQLSPISNYSSKTCTAVPGRDLANIIVAGNLELERLIIGANPLVHKSDQASSLLATVGYLVINDQLTISADTLIISAGDIFINELTSLEKGNPYLTLVSASGYVNISSSAPTINLQVFGKMTPQTALIKQVKTNQILPPLLQKETLGIYAPRTAVTTK